MRLLADIFYRSLSLTIWIVIIFLLLVLYRCS